MVNRAADQGSGSLGSGQVAARSSNAPPVDRLLNVHDVKKNPRYERWRWTTFSVTWLAYAGFYLTRKAFSVAKNELKKPEVLGLTKVQMSEMDAAYSAAYAVGQFFWGTLGDRYGTRKVVLFGMMASVVTAALMGSVKSVLWMALLFAFQGLWQASGWAPLGKNMGEFFSQRERGSV